MAGEFLFLLYFNTLYPLLHVHHQLLLSGFNSCLTLNISIALLGNPITVAGKHFQHIE